MKEKLLIIGLTLFVVTASVAVAITPGTVPGSQDLGLQGPRVETVGGLVGILASVVIWIYYIFFVVAVLFVILAAFGYLTSGGQPEEIKTVHKRLMYAAIAIAVALLSVSVNLIVRNFLISPAGGGNNPPQDSPPVSRPA